MADTKENISKIENEIIERKKLSRNTFLDKSAIDMKLPLFVSNLSNIVFENFIPFRTYQRRFSLTNIDSVPRKILCKGCSSKLFTCQLISPEVDTLKTSDIFSDSGILRVAPGMKVICVVNFRPENLNQQSAKAYFETDRELFSVELSSKGSPILVKFPNILDFGNIPVNKGISKTLLIRNLSTGNISFLIKSSTKYLKFFPQTGEILENKSRQVVVILNQVMVCKYSEMCEVIFCNEFGQRLNGSINIIATILERKIYFTQKSLIFGSCFVSLSQSRSITLQNDSNFCCKFEWIKTDNVFLCYPASGEIWSHSKIIFAVFFKPIVAEKYESSLKLYVEGKNLNLEVMCLGEGLAPVIHIVPNMINFMNIYPGEEFKFNFEVQNKGHIKALVDCKKALIAETKRCICFEPNMFSLEVDETKKVIATLKILEVKRFSHLLNIFTSGAKPSTYPSLLVKGNVIAPIFAVDQSEVDFGIVGTTFAKILCFKVINKSRVPLEFGVSIKDFSENQDVAEKRRLALSSVFTALSFNKILRAGESCAIDIKFLASSKGVCRGVAEVIAKKSNEIASLMLLGNSQTPRLRLATFKESLTSNLLPRSSTINNSNTSGLGYNEDLNIIVSMEDITITTSKSFSVFIKNEGLVSARLGVDIQELPEWINVTETEIIIRKQNWGVFEFEVTPNELGTINELVFIRVIGSSKTARVELRTSCSLPKILVPDRISFPPAHCARIYQKKLFFKNNSSVPVILMLGIINPAENPFSLSTKELALNPLSTESVIIYLTSLREETCNALLVALSYKHRQKYVISLECKTYGHSIKCENCFGEQLNVTSYVRNIPCRKYWGHSFTIQNIGSIEQLVTLVSSDNACVSENKKQIILEPYYECDINTKYFFSEPGKYEESVLLSNEFAGKSSTALQYSLFADVVEPSLRFEKEKLVYSLRTTEQIILNSYKVRVTNISPYSTCFTAHSAKPYLKIYPQKLLLGPGQHTEITLFVSKEEIMKYELQNFLERVKIVFTNLVNDQTECLPVEINFVIPDLDFPGRIDFGNIEIGDTPSILFSLRNKSSVITRYEIYDSSESALSFHPSFGHVASNGVTQVRVSFNSTLVNMTGSIVSQVYLNILNGPTKVFNVFAHLSCPKFTFSTTNICYGKCQYLEEQKRSIVISNIGKVSFAIKVLKLPNHVFVEELPSSSNSTSTNLAVSLLCVHLGHTSQKFDIMIESNNMSFKQTIELRYEGFLEYCIMDLPIFFNSRFEWHILRDLMKGAFCDDSYLPKKRLADLTSKELYSCSYYVNLFAEKRVKEKIFHFFNYINFGFEGFPRMKNKRPTLFKFILDFGILPFGKKSSKIISIRASSSKFELRESFTFKQARFLIYPSPNQPESSKLEYRVDYIPLCPQDFSIMSSSKQSYVLTIDKDSYFSIVLLVKVQIIIPNVSVLPEEPKLSIGPVPYNAVLAKTFAIINENNVDVNVRVKSTIASIILPTNKIICAGNQMTCFNIIFLSSEVPRVGKIFFKFEDIFLEDIVRDILVSPDSSSSSTSITVGGISGDISNEFTLPSFAPCEPFHFNVEINHSETSLEENVLLPNLLLADEFCQQINEKAASDVLGDLPSGSEIFVDPNLMSCSFYNDLLLRLNSDTYLLCDKRKNVVFDFLLYGTEFSSIIKVGNVLGNKFRKQIYALSTFLSEDECILKALHKLCNTSENGFILMIDLPGEAIPDILFTALKSMCKENLCLVIEVANNFWEHITIEDLDMLGLCSVKETEGKPLLSKLSLAANLILHSKITGSISCQIISLQQQVLTSMRIMFGDSIQAMILYRLNRTLEGTAELRPEVDVVIQRERENKKPTTKSKFNIKIMSRKELSCARFPFVFIDYSLGYLHYLLLKFFCESPKLILFQEKTTRNLFNGKLFLGSIPVAATLSLKFFLQNVGNVVAEIKEINLSGDDDIKLTTKHEDISSIKPGDLAEIELEIFGLIKCMITGSLQFLLFRQQYTCTIQARVVEMRVTCFPTNIQHQVFLIDEKKEQFSVIKIFFHNPSSLEYYWHMNKTNCKNVELRSTQEKGVVRRKRKESITLNLAANKEGTSENVLSFTFSPKLSLAMKKPLSITHDVNVVCEVLKFKYEIVSSSGERCSQIIADFGQVLIGFNGSLQFKIRNLAQADIYPSIICDAKKRHSFSHLIGKGSLSYNIDKVRIKFQEEAILKFRISPTKINEVRKLGFLSLQLSCFNQQLNEYIALSRERIFIFCDAKCVEYQYSLNDSTSSVNSVVRTGKEITRSLEIENTGDFTLDFVVHSKSKLRAINQSRSENLEELDKSRLQQCFNISITSGTILPHETCGINICIKVLQNLNDSLVFYIANSRSQVKISNGISIGGFEIPINLEARDPALEYRKLWQVFPFVPILNSKHLLAQIDYDVVYSADSSELIFRELYVTERKDIFVKLICKSSFHFGVCCQLISEDKDFCKYVTLKSKSFKLSPGCAETLVISCVGFAPSLKHGRCIVKVEDENSDIDKVVLLEFGVVVNCIEQEIYLYYANEDNDSGIKKELTTIQMNNVMNHCGIQIGTNTMRRQDVLCEIVAAKTDILKLTRNKFTLSSRKRAKFTVVLSAAIHEIYKAKFVVTFSHEGYIAKKSVDIIFKPSSLPSKQLVYGLHFYANYFLGYIALPSIGITSRRCRFQLPIINTSAKPVSVLLVSDNHDKKSKCSLEVATDSTVFSPNQSRRVPFDIIVRKNSKGENVELSLKVVVTNELAQQHEKCIALTFSTEIDNNFSINTAMGGKAEMIHINTVSGCTSYFDLGIAPPRSVEIISYDRNFISNYSRGLDSQLALTLPPQFCGKMETDILFKNNLLGAHTHKVKLSLSIVALAPKFTLRTSTGKLCRTNNAIVLYFETLWTKCVHRVDLNILNTTRKSQIFSLYSMGKNEHINSSCNSGKIFPHSTFILHFDAKVSASANFKLVFQNSSLDEVLEVKIVLKQLEVTISPLVVKLKDFSIQNQASQIFLLSNSNSQPVVVSYIGVKNMNPYSKTDIKCRLSKIRITIPPESTESFIVYFQGLTTGLFEVSLFFKIESQNTTFRAMVTGNIIHIEDIRV